MCSGRVYSHICTHVHRHAGGARAHGGLGSDGMPVSRRRRWPDAGVSTSDFSTRSFILFKEKDLHLPLARVDIVDSGLGKDCKAGHNYYGP